MIMTDFNRCKGCRHYTEATRATSVCTEKACERVPYPASNLIKFTARDRFGSVEYRLDLRGITTMMDRHGQNMLIAEILKSAAPCGLLHCWLEYVEWIREHEGEEMPAPILRRVTTLRNRLILYLERIEQDAGR